MAGKRFARILLLRATEQISAEKTISKKKLSNYRLIMFIV
jgi:hypothetical protein